MKGLSGWHYRLSCAWGWGWGSVLVTFRVAGAARKQNTKNDDSCTFKEDLVQLILLKAVLHTSLHHLLRANSYRQHWLILCSLLTSLTDLAFRFVLLNQDIEDSAIW